MSKKKAETALVPSAGQSLLEPWEAELEDEAAKARNSVEGIGGANYASIRGGRLKIGGNEVPGGEIAVVVLAYANVKAYYEGEFNADESASPVCYAIGDLVKGLAPHPESPTKCNATCQGCPKNDFGTARTGKGKACKDQVRLAFIEGGTLAAGGWTSPESNKVLEMGEVVTLSVPPTSISAWANYLRAIATNFKRPPFAVYTKIKVTPDDKKQVAVTFECLGQLEKEQIPVVRRRVEGAAEGAFAPFPKIDKAAKPAEPVKRRAKF